MKQVCVPLRLQDSLDNKEKRRIAKLGYFFSPPNPIIHIETMEKRSETQVPINAIIHMESEKRKGTQIPCNPITCVETVEKREESQFLGNPIILAEPVETRKETQTPRNPIILVNDILVETCKITTPWFRRLQK